MVFKVTSLAENETHLINKIPSSIAELIIFVRQSFPRLNSQWLNFYYLDSENEKISLNQDQDLEMFLKEFQNLKKVPKLFLEIQEAVQPKPRKQKEYFDSGPQSQEDLDYQVPPIENIFIEQKQQVEQKEQKKEEKVQEDQDLICQNQKNVQISEKKIAGFKLDQNIFDQLENQENQENQKNQINKCEREKQNLDEEDELEEIFPVQQYNKIQEYSQNNNQYPSHVLGCCKTKEMKGQFQEKRRNFIQQIVREEIRRLVREDCLVLEEIIKDEKEKMERVKEEKVSQVFKGYGVFNSSKQEKNFPFKQQNLEEKTQQEQEQTKKNFNKLQIGNQDNTILIKYQNKEVIQPVTQDQKMKILVDQISDIEPGFKNLNQEYVLQQMKQLNLSNINQLYNWYLDLQAN